jgi:hypothetical protein
LTSSLPSPRPQPRSRVVNDRPNRLSTTNLPSPHAHSTLSSPHGLPIFQPPFPPSSSFTHHRFSTGGGGGQQSAGAGAGAGAAEVPASPRPYPPAPDATFPAAADHAPAPSTEDSVHSPCSPHSPLPSPSGTLSRIRSLPVASKQQQQQQQLHQQASAEEPVRTVSQWHADSRCHDVCLKGNSACIPFHQPRE